MDFDMFFRILILSQSDDFAWAIAFVCMMADFQNALISQIFGVFGAAFSQNNQSEDFAWAIAFACMMADFQNALISRIFGVFWSGFLHRTTVNDL